MRKNNVTIFNLNYESGDLLNFTLVKLNEHLGLNLEERNINNIYATGKSNANRPIMVEFISFIKKQSVFKNRSKLKDTNISIIDELSIEERQQKSLLVRHLKVARDNHQKAYMRGQKLFVNGKPYTVNELKNPDKEIGSPEISDSNSSGRANHKNQKQNTQEQALEQETTYVSEDKGLVHQNALDRKGGSRSNLETAAFRTRSKNKNVAPK